MRNDDLGDLLARWAHWAIAGNRAGLGYAMVAYAERVGSSFSVDNTPAPVDPEILRIDDAIRKLPQEYNLAIRVHYLMPGTAKSKMARYDWSRERYYELLDHGRAFIAHLIKEDIL